MSRNLYHYRRRRARRKAIRGPNFIIEWGPEEDEEPPVLEEVFASKPFVADSPPPIIPTEEVEGLFSPRPTVGSVLLDLFPLYARKPAIGTVLLDKDPLFVSKLSASGLDISPIYAQKPQFSETTVFGFSDPPLEAKKPTTIGIDGGGSNYTNYLPVPKPSARVGGDFVPCFHFKAGNCSFQSLIALNRNPGNYGVLTGQIDPDLFPLSQGGEAWIEFSIKYRRYATDDDQSQRIKHWPGVPHALQDEKGVAGPGVFDSGRWYTVPRLNGQISVILEFWAQLDFKDTSGGTVSDVPVYCPSFYFVDLPFRRDIY